MADYLDFLQAEVDIPQWPYPLRYGVENEIAADVLVLGGGVAGSHAALTLAGKGLKTVMVEKGGAKKAGSGGVGVDHWHYACTNPASRVTPEEMAETVVETQGEYECGIFDYINCKEGYDALLDCERLGVKIREGEAPETVARNPHELVRTLECLTRLTAGEMIMHASLARKASSFILDFKRLDFPEVGPVEWNKFITVRLDGGDVKVEGLPFGYWLQAPYASTYKL